MKCESCQNTIGYSTDISLPFGRPSLGQNPQLKELKPLRYGSIHRCTKCASLWFHDPDRNWMQRTPKDRLDLILAWNEREVRMSRNNIFILKNIGQTHADIYGNGNQYEEFPCRVITNKGEQTNLAIISFQKHPPFEENRTYRLASEIIQVMESPCALPLDVRHASTQAQELRMGFSPLIIESTGQCYTLNGTTNFFSKRDVETKEITVSKKKVSLHELPPIASEPANITYFVADPTEI